MRLKAQYQRIAQANPLFFFFFFDGVDRSRCYAVPEIYSSVSANDKMKENAEEKM